MATATTKKHSKTHKFSLGQVVATRGAVEAVENCHANILEYIARHAEGDWGEVSPADARLNEESLRDGARLMSAYTLPRLKTKIWVITEADRSSTTVLLPSEY